MASIDKTFYVLCKKILSYGAEYENKNRGVKRLQIPSYTFRHDLDHDGFPAITTKKLPFKTVVGELIWFLRGDNDIEYLNKNGIKIWNKDAYNWYCKQEKQKELSYAGYKSNLLSFEEFSKQGKGSVGQNYGVQWRRFNGKTDQISDLIKGMKADIMSSRLKVNAWNPSEIDETALPPCHSEFQIIGVPLSLGHRSELGRAKLYAASDKTDFEYDEKFDIRDAAHLDELDIPEFGFELHWNQRSVDVFLGLPFNIASYALLAHILERITGYPALAIEGTLKCVHFYDNQYAAAKELVSRNTDTHANCSLVFNDPGQFGYPFTKSIDDYFNALSIADFSLEGYTHDPEIKVDMLAPKE